MAASGHVDIEELCRSRPLPGVEHFGGNELYGHSRIIKTYAGLHRERPLPALIPHGVYWSDSRMELGEARAGYPVALSYPAYRDRVYRERARMVAVPCAAPFLYALQVIKPKPERRAGALCFPGHSLPGVQLLQDWDALAAELDSRKESLGSIRVCVHWADALQGRHSAFERRGLQVTCAGHSHDMHFLDRLVELLRGHEWVLTNAIGSHVFYALAAGCRLLFIGDQPLPAHGAKVSGASLGIDRGTVGVDMARLRRLGSLEDGSGLDEMRSIADTYLRRDALMDPAELRAVLAWCSLLDRRGSLFTPGVRPMSRPIPRLWYRHLKRITLGVRRGPFWKAVAPVLDRVQRG